MQRAKIWGCKACQHPDSPQATSQAPFPCPPKSPQLPAHLGQAGPWWQLLGRTGQGLGAVGRARGHQGGADPGQIPPVTPSLTRGHRAPARPGHQRALGGGRWGWWAGGRRVGVSRSLPPASSRCPGEGRGDAGSWKQPPGGGTQHLGTPWVSPGSVWPACPESCPHCGWERAAGAWGGGRVGRGPAPSQGPPHALK